jgi:excisionase family DNA binding protein
MSAMREIMTPPQVAEYLQLTTETVYRYIREGKLVASRLGRQYRVPRESVEMLLEATSTAGNARLRSFTSEEVAAWLEEDQINEATKATGEKLLAALKQHPS